MQLVAALSRHEWVWLCREREQQRQRQLQWLERGQLEQRRPPRSIPTARCARHAVPPVPGKKESGSCRLRTAQGGRTAPAGEIHAQRRLRLRLSGRAVVPGPANRSREVSGPPALFRRGDDVLEEPSGSRLQRGTALPSFDDACSFESLYRAHLAARRGKQDRREVIDFELDLGANLARLSHELAAGTYKLLPYTHFTVTDPKRREIHALRYRDRVVQHALCDNVVAPLLEPRLIYDNAACRRGRGTHFALARLEGFLREHWRRYGPDGWVLKVDVHHFFATISHEVLLGKLLRVPFDAPTRTLLERIIASYEDSPGCGLPLGNQTSQWFALYYLDSLDRLVKERLGVRGYVRYMDDMVLLAASKGEARTWLRAMEEHAADLRLCFNRKTQVAPLSQGIDFLGWHLYLCDGGRVVRRLRASAKRRMRAKLRALGCSSDAYADAVRQSYHAHLAHGDAHGLDCRPCSADPKLFSDGENCAAILPAEPV